VTGEDATALQMFGDCWHNGLAPLQ